MTEEELALQHTLNIAKDQGAIIGVGSSKDIRDLVRELPSSSVRIDCPVCKSTDYVRLCFLPGMKDIRGVSCGKCDIFVPPGIWAILHDKIR